MRTYTIMYNLRTIRGTLKGRVGEAIFLSLNKYAHGTNFDHYYWLNKLDLDIPDTMKEFLMTYWSTIDAFEFMNEGNKVLNLILYEIKTVNHYAQGINFGNKSCLTKHTALCYRMAQKLGYIVKSVSVILFDRWNFDIQIAPYKQEFYQIHDGNPTYSKAVPTLAHKDTDQIDQ